MKFKDYINSEAVTIMQFIDKQNNIKLNELKNESFSVYDFTFISAGTPSEYFTPQIEGICEAKTRNYKSTDFPSGCLIQLDKLTNVMKAVAKEKDIFSNINKTIKGFYLSKYKDRTFLFDLESITFGQIKYMKLPKYTAGSNTDWIYKPVLVIPYEDSILSY